MNATRWSVDGHHLTVSTGRIPRRWQVTIRGDRLRLEIPAAPGFLFLRYKVVVT
jgi:hypothetical protein